MYWSALPVASMWVKAAHTEIGLGVWRVGTRSTKAFKITWVMCLPSTSQLWFTSPSPQRWLVSAFRVQNDVFSLKSNNKNNNKHTLWLTGRRELFWTRIYDRWLWNTTPMLANSQVLNERGVRCPSMFVTTGPHPHRIVAVGNEAKPPNYTTVSVSKSLTVSGFWHFTFPSLFQWKIKYLLQTSAEGTFRRVSLGFFFFLLNYRAPSVQRLPQRAANQRPLSAV